MAANLGEAVRAARLERKWSQRDLAARLNVSQPAVSMYEHDRITPTLDHFRELVRTLDLDAGKVL